MARKAMVTRTINTTQATVLCMDLTTSQPVEKILTLPRTYKNNKDLMKAVEVAIADDTIKAVHVKNTEVVETLYGMTEQDFINSAIKLDPETRKAI